MIKKSYSYPERLKDTQQREYKYGCNEIIIQSEVLHKYREKDHQRTEQLASLGSFSSVEPIVHTPGWKERCCITFGNMVNYFLERGEESKRQDEIIQTKSYAGFYYFIKWFVRSFFFLLFTTLGTIAGKEVGCAIKEHDVCSADLVDLIDSSPHLIASILGSIFGLLFGQWVGRLLWDYSSNNVQICLRKLETYTKINLYILAIFVYIIITGSFTLIFFFFVDIGQDEENIVGGIIGGGIGVVCAILAYKKTSHCS